MNERAELIIEYAPAVRSGFDAADVLFVGALLICFLAITFVVQRILDSG